MSWSKLFIMGPGSGTSKGGQARRPVRGKPPHNLADLVTYGVRLAVIINLIIDLVKKRSMIEYDNGSMTYHQAQHMWNKEKFDAVRYGLMITRPGSDGIRGGASTLPLNQQESRKTPPRQHNGNHGFLNTWNIPRKKKRGVDC